MLAMKQILLAGLLSLGLLSSAQAGYVNVFAGNHIKLYNGIGSGNGGEFDAVLQEFNGSSYDPTDVTWSTFCLEVDEYFHYGQLLNVAGVSDTAYAGGSNTDAGDPISYATAWLYTQMSTGTLVGLNAAGTEVSGSYSDNHVANATYLQKAIWYLEDESLGVHNKYVDLALEAGWTSIGDVRVLNLERYKNGQWVHAQDQLVLLSPLQVLPPLVPEPSTFALFGIGGLALAGYGWRRKRRAA